ncbi:LLM class flavin-dependent oxidoreductase [Mesobacillus thioparans]|uniref:LLM class flavin-dependent oxidoreductase n=1 Tax=Mesobacillus thioparans TaxID=370439 RepID=UPI0039EE1DD5
MTMQLLQNNLNISLMLPLDHHSLKHEHQEELITLADFMGYHGIWVRDIIMTPTDSTDIGTGYEIMTYLSYLAGITKNIRLGSAVLSTLCRDEIITAKQIATIDQLSKGRLDIGFGYGDRGLELNYFGMNQKEKDKYFHSKIHTIQSILKKGFIESKGLDKGIVSPPPYQKNIPFWIATKSLKITNNQFENYLSYFCPLDSFKKETKPNTNSNQEKGMLFWISLTDPDLTPIQNYDLQENFPVLRGTSAEILKILNEYRKLGLTLGIVNFVGPSDIKQQMERFSEKILPKLKVHNVLTT